MPRVLLNATSRTCSSTATTEIILCGLYIAYCVLHIAYCTEIIILHIAYCVATEIVVCGLHITYCMANRIIYCVLCVHINHIVCPHKSYCITKHHIVLWDYNMPMKRKHLEWPTTIDEPFTCEGYDSIHIHVWSPRLICAQISIDSISSPVIREHMNDQSYTILILIHLYENCNMKYLQLNIIILLN
jgi:hypothetical protein